MLGYVCGRNETIKREGDDDVPNSGHEIENLVYDREKLLLRAGHGNWRR